MSERQFEEFDERFKDAAEQYEPPFDEASWKKLEGRLNEAPPQKRRAGWWWLTDALIIGLLLYIAYQWIPTHTESKADNHNDQPTLTARPKNDNAASLAGTNQLTVPEIGATTDGKVEDQNGVIKDASLNTATSVSTTASKVNRAETAMSGNGGLKTSTYHSNIIAKGQSGQLTGMGLQQARITAEDEFAGQGSLEDQQKNLQDVPVPNAGIVGPDNKLSKPGALVMENNTLLVLPGMSIETADHVAPASLPEPAGGELAAGLVPSNSKISMKPSRRFYVFGMAGSEWSLVTGNDPGKASFTWGAGLGYRISPKWAVQAGYFSTQKLYDAGPGDYKPKPGTYYYNLTIKHVEANCEVTEIPIMLSYSLLSKKRQSLFATVGLSSYIMNSEEYHYDYIRANQTPGYAKYRYETHNSHLFAGLLLSGGYSFRLFDGLSLSAEPYLKIPLYGVGEGSIKIYNFGAMAGAKYTLPSFRRK